MAGSTPDTAQHFTIGGSPSQRPKRKPKAPPVDKTELQSGFYHGFRSFAKISRSTELVEKSEFLQMADAYESLAKRYPTLGYIILILAPLSVIGEMYDKATRIWESRTRWLHRNTVDAVSVTEVPQGDDGDNHTT